MSRKRNGLNFNRSIMAQERRRGALGRLKVQLGSNQKTTKDGVVDLDDSDKKRIEKEIKNLERKLAS